jgi:branched-chain amino acid transport system substrate-binding protein
MSDPKSRQARGRIFSRREFLGTVTAATAAVAVSASAAPARAQAPARVGRTLKIGHITPRTGFIGQSGAYAAMGINMAVDEWNAKAGPGADKFEVIAEDSVNPGVAIQKATKLIEKDKVDFIFGEMSSASSLAIMQVCQKFKKLYFNTGSNSDELRQAKCNRYSFHVESSNSQMILSTGRYLVKNKKVNRWYFVTPDYTYGYDCYNLANGILKKEGGTNLGQDLVPTGTTDFSSYILKIKAANPDLVFTSLAGTDMALFVKQFNEFGLKCDLALSHMETVSVWSTGKEALKGIGAAVYYFKQPGAESEGLVTRFYNKFGKPPDDNVWKEFMALRALTLAMEKTGGTDTNKIIQFLESGYEFDIMKSRKGRFTPYDHQLLMELYLLKPKPKDKITDAWDLVDIESTQPEPSEPLEAIHITKEDNKCTFPPL